MAEKSDYSKISSFPIKENIHPDGQAWKKCCRGDTTNKLHKRLESHNEPTLILNCLNKRLESPNNEPNLIINCAFIDKRMTKEKNKTSLVPFVCCHRTTEDGYARVCAGWHACYGEEWKAKNGKHT